MRRFLFLGMVVCLAAGLGRAAPLVAGADAMPVGAGQERSAAHKILMYLPNRALDFIDIFRIRVRVGPGLAVNLRGTEYLTGYAGSYKSVYLGLPGPRATSAVRKPYGREDLKGLMLVGADATDDTPYDPEYSLSEFTLGAHVLVVGADMGFDPVQLGDFFAGLVGFDPRGDDR